MKRLVTIVCSVHKIMCPTKKLGSGEEVGIKTEVDCLPTKLAEKIAINHKLAFPMQL